MPMEAELISPDEKHFSVIRAALFHGICRFPQLFVIVESEEPLSNGRYTFHLNFSQAYTVASPLLESVWHSYSIHQSDPNRYLLCCSSDPSGLMQLRPFAANNGDARALLEPRLHKETAWQASEYASKPIESLLSNNESLEQLARRVAQYTDDVFVLHPCAKYSDGWEFHWADSAHSLLRAAKRTLAGADLSVQMRSRYQIEPHLQRLTVPTQFDSALLQASEMATVRQLVRPIQLGVAGATARSNGPALNELNEPIADLHLEWHDVVRTDTLEALWHSGIVKGEAEGTDALVLSSLFLYENGSAQSQTARALQERSHWIGTQDQDSDIAAQGWVACALCMPITAIPADKVLLDQAINHVAPEKLWSRMVAHMGCGQHNLAPHAAVSNGPMAAVVVNRASGSDPISRSQDPAQYRTKIWVRVLGTDTDLEVDYATPLASFGGNGDLMLVPDANTLGFVLCQQGTGAPMFFAQTHYRDDPVSAELESTVHVHGLVTNGGLLLREVNDETMIHASDRIRTKSMNHKRETGE